MSEKTEEVKNEATDIEIVGVGFKNACKVYYFDPRGKKYSKNDKVVVETSRGVELGDLKIENTKVPAAKISSPLKPVTRLATPDDIARDEKSRKAEEDAAKIFKKKVQDYKLEMNFVGAEYTLDGYGRKALVPKAKIHAALGCSPDEADAIALTCGYAGDLVEMERPGGARNGNGGAWVSRAAKW